MNKSQKYIFRLGKRLSSYSDAHIVSGILISGITILIGLTSIRKGLLSLMNSLGLMSGFTVLVFIKFVFLGLLLILSIFITIGTIDLFVRWVARKMIWFGEYKRGNKIAKILLSIEKSEKNQNGFDINFKNREKLNAFGIKTSCKFLSKDGVESGIEKMISPLLVSYLDESKSHGSFNLDSKKEVDVFLLEFDEEKKKFYTRRESDDKVYFGVGTYELNISFYGGMERKQVIGGLTGEMAIKNKGLIDFNVKQVKQRRGWVSLVPQMPFG